MSKIQALEKLTEEPDGVYADVLEETLGYAREQQYTGWDYADGMSSRILRSLPVDAKWINLAFQETIKRAPVNVRPLFLVEQRRNFMGAALFVLANLNAYHLTGEERFRNEAADLTEWLIEHQSDRCEPFCGCHRHDLQTLDGKTEAGTPGVVGTSYGVRALLAAANEIDDRCAEVAHTAADFVFDHLGYETIDDGARINYKLTDDGEYYTLNANALGARLLIDLHAHRPRPRLREAATNILEYVVSRQTDRGGWHYRDPQSASHLSMDNFHNGFIIESLLRYRAITGDDRFDGAIDRATTFYRHTLFEENGAPNWDEEDAYPRDVHASAQGILVFAKVNDPAFARQILDWTLEQLYGGDGRFYFRKHRLYTKRITLMRWCQAWMAYALSEYLRETQQSASILADDR